MAKKNNDYFKLMEQQVSYCMEASNYLESVIYSYDASKIATYRKEMHELEHAADKIQHDIFAKLSTEFITPIDQEDILSLVQIIDDITDALDEVVMEFYMYHINEIPENAFELSKIVNGCVSALLDAIKELHNFKKPEKLRSLLIKVNDIETEGDRIFFDAIHKLFSSESDAKKLISEKEIYESLEMCCDLCEHATDVIEQVIIKNT